MPMFSVCMWFPGFIQWDTASGSNEDLCMEKIDLSSQIVFSKQMYTISRCILVQFVDSFSSLFSFLYIRCPHINEIKTQDEKITCAISVSTSLESLFPIVVIVAAKRPGSVAPNLANGATGWEHADSVFHVLHSITRGLMCSTFSAVFDEPHFIKIFTRCEDCEGASCRNRISTSSKETLHLMVWCELL